MTHTNSCWVCLIPIDTKTLKIQDPIYGQALSQFTGKNAFKLPIWLHQYFLTLVFIYILF